MAFETLTTPRSELPNVYQDVTPRNIDFVTRFGRDMTALTEILGVMRPIRKAPGTTLISYNTTVALENGDVPAGAVIPYSKATTTQVAKEDIEVKKYAKAVPIEDVNQYGAAIAVQKSDDAFLYELQMNVLTAFYAFLNTGSLAVDADSFQMALAKAKGAVIDKFNKIRRTVTEVVGFANVLDLYEYIGAANLTIQTQHGVTYLKDFMGYSTLILLSEPDIARGKVIALPVENIDLYYIDPADSEFAKLGLNYTVDGVTNLIGFHSQGNYGTAVGESYALMGMKLWAEYLDGIAVATISAAAGG